MRKFTEASMRLMKVLDGQRFTVCGQKVSEWANHALVRQCDRATGAEWPLERSGKTYFPLPGRLDVVKVRLRKFYDLSPWELWLIVPGETPIVAPEGARLHLIWWWSKGWR